MTRLRRGWKRFIGVLTRHQWEQECADELESHILMQTEDNIRLGMSAEEARRIAVLKFGNLESTKEDLRDQRGLPRLEWLLKDVRYAVRGLRRNPGFAAATIATLALGVGANTAIFDVAYAVLLKPLPYSDPGRLYSVGVLVPERRQSGHLPIPIQLGAGRARMLSLAITESTMLAILGGAVGVVIAKHGVNLLATFGPHELRHLADTRVNPPALLFAIAASVMTGIVCGLVACRRGGTTTGRVQGANPGLGLAFPAVRTGAKMVSDSNSVSWVTPSPENNHEDSAGH